MVKNCGWKCIGRKKFNLSCETKLRLVYDSYLLSETAFLDLHNNGSSRAVSNTHTSERDNYTHAEHTSLPVHTHPTRMSRVFIGGSL